MCNGCTVYGRGGDYRNLALRQSQTRCCCRITFAVIEVMMTLVTWLLLALVFSIFTSCQWFSSSFYLIVALLKPHILNLTHFSSLPSSLSSMFLCLYCCMKNAFHQLDSQPCNCPGLFIHEEHRVHCKSIPIKILGHGRQIAALNVQVWAL